MPLLYQQNINDKTKLGVWHITEPESFFIKTVPLQREISHPHKRLQHFAGRYLLKELYPDFPYELIKIADTRKPFLENEAYHFSISHCGDYAAVIVSKENRVGVDIELFTDKIDKIKDKFLSANELSILQSLPNFQFSIFNFQLLAWCIKEAVYKWYGNGGVDFKEHIHINNIKLETHKGTASCIFSKDGNIELKLDFIFFEDKCLAWVVN